MNTHTVDLYIRKVAKPEQITEEAIAAFPAGRQQRIRSVKHEPTRAELFTAGLLLREVLGVSKDEDLVFSGNGKPYLSSGECFFSLSHDDQYAVLATAPVEIGVDIEEKKELMEVVRRRVFTEEERSFLSSEPERNAVVLWTRLEAALKLSGEGIAGLDHRTFSLLEDSESCRFRTIDHEGSFISVACREDFEIRLGKMSDI